MPTRPRCYNDPVDARLTRIILYVQDVDRLSAFYRDLFGLAVIEEIAGEWAVLKAGACELALHRVGKALSCRQCAEPRQPDLCRPRSRLSRLPSS